MTRQHGWAGKAPVWLVAAASVFVAVEAFRLAYTGSRGAALDMGVPPSSAGSYPWCIEGVIVVASTATIALPRGDRRLAWLVLLGFTAISCAANVLHSLDAAGHKIWSPGFAVVPPLALPLCVRLAERVALSTLGSLTAGGRSLSPAGPDSAVPGGRHPGRDSGHHLDAAAGPLSTPPPAPDPTGVAVDGGPVDTPSTVRRAAPAAGRPQGAEVDGGLSTVLSAAVLSTPGEVDGPVDVHPHLRAVPQDTPGAASTPRPPRVRQDKTGGRRSPKAARAAAITAELGVSRSRAYTLADDPQALARARAARAQANGHTPAGAS